MGQKEDCRQSMACEMSLLSRADGSASFSLGDDAAVIACVYGPTDVRISKEKIDRATVDVLVKPKIGMQNCASKLKEEIIRNSVEASVIGTLHPRTGINVIVQEIQGKGSSGSLLAASINATCLALLDAGLPMRSMFAAVSCACRQKEISPDTPCTSNEDEDLEMVVEPNEEEEEEADIVLTFAFESVDNKVVASHFGSGGSGKATNMGMSNNAFKRHHRLSERKLQECLSLCSLATKGVFQFYRDCLKQKLTVDTPEAAKAGLIFVSKLEEERPNPTAASVKSGPDCDMTRPGM